MPLVVVSTDDIRGTVEKEIAESERLLKAAKKQKRGQQTTPAETGNPTAAGSGDTSGSVVILEDDVFEIPSDDEIIRVSGGAAPKAAKKAPKDDAAIQARKLQRERSAAWKKEIQKASGLLAMLQRCCTALDTTSARAAKSSVVSLDLMDEAKAKNFSLKQRFSSP